jgi:hypothetical protein
MGCLLDRFDAGGSTPVAQIISLGQGKAVLECVGGSMAGYYAIVAVNAIFDIAITEAAGATLGAAIGIVLMFLVP